MSNIAEQVASVSRQVWLNHVVDQNWFEHQHVRLESATFEECDFKNLNLDLALFYNCIFSEVRFIDCEFNGTVFIGCTFEECQFDNCLFNNIHLADSLLAECEGYNCFANGLFIKVELDQGVVRGCLLDKSASVISACEARGVIEDTISEALHDTEEGDEEEIKEVDETEDLVEFINRQNPSADDGVIDCEAD